MFSRILANVSAILAEAELRSAEQRKEQQVSPTPGRHKQSTPQSKVYRRTTLTVPGGGKAPQVELKVNKSQQQDAVDPVTAVEIDDSALPADLTLYVPFRKYTLTLRHQILSSLGKVSQFVLQALATDGFGINDIVRITGLSPTHLSPILERLAGLGWYEPSGGVLTVQGRIMAQAATIAGQRFSLWMDGHVITSLPQILLSDERLLTPEMTGTGITLNEFERDWNILSVLQQQRLARRLSGEKNSQGELLPLMKRLCDASCHAAIDSQRTAWDFRLEIDREASQCHYLAVTLPQGLLPGGGKGKFLYAPVMNYRITRSLPALLAADMSQPDPLCLTFCQITGRKLNDPGHEDQDSSWPLDAILPRTELLEKVRASVPPCDPLLSQVVSLTTAVRKLTLNYVVLASEMEKNIPSLLGDEQ